MCSVLDGDATGQEDHLYELPADVCKKWFREGRFGRLGTIGDGSCFFHSVCLALDTHGYAKAPRSQRIKIARAMRTALSALFTEKDYDEILDTLQNKKPKSFKNIKRMLGEPTTWAEEIMIKWASKALGINVVFLNLGHNVNKMYCGVHDIKTLEKVENCDRPTKTTVIVAWAAHAHFELVVRLDNVNNDEVEVTTSFDPPDTTIVNVMQAYATQCKL